jgi:glucose-6-phosphate isomerase
MAAPIGRTATWHELQEAATDVPDLRTLFATDPGRAGRLTHELGDLVVDASKHLVTPRVLDLLARLAEERGVLERLRATQAGEHVNTTEDRAVLHTALRLPRDAELVVDGQDVVADVHDALDRVDALATRVRDGSWTGATGERIRTVVNVGIGGSDLGPRMVVEALADRVHPELDVRFVSNVDPDDVATVLAQADPATTLVIVVSKTFGTIETLLNARTLRRWIVDALGEDAVSSHFVAVSTNAERVAAFGIDTDDMIGFWDWVGGRYSLSSAVGLSVAIALGPDAFRELLDGMRLVDEHARTAPLRENVPVLLGLLQCWYGSVLGLPAQAVLPYSRRLRLFTPYLQQLEMESNGKRVTLDGDPVTVDTGAVVWGQPGTDGQHAFFQLLHQGTRVVPVDLIGFLEPADDLEVDGGNLHDHLLGNLLAQSAALAFGRTSREVADAGEPPALVPHRTFPGNRPSTVILASRRTPFVLGQLIALYEQKVAVLAALWGTNAYDQYGVELGKVLATEIVELLTAPDDRTHDGRRDASTAALARRVRAARGRTADDAR